ncbi:hypothetical protein CORC01_02911 [Colletotrichum orchidophilum]|uniref:BZIP domain-containing protein n=1 Tax=Colletotrichum orchidophilum TaxID=1209926 RepID=A0A1G4BJQ1_9PEZI|nr:uncharacterized protein CORC01_02911 [Colletotrichum orchidophilum]OHF01720.1 hypothetical protein CORC01_02911 [Colletotrichum orchidophilum]
MSSEQDYQDLFGPQAKRAKRGRQQLQTDKSANAIRIRDNQRRSRARHKEFVDELQRKVQDYEKRGTQASLQMQKAARDVAFENSRLATENTRLRALLASRGVSNSEVDAHLQSFDDEGSKGSPSASNTTTLAPILNTPILLEPLPTQLPPLQEHFGKAGFSSETENENLASQRKFGDSLLPPVLTLTPTSDVQQSSPLDRLAVLADASLNRSSSQAGPTTNSVSEPSRSPHPYHRRSETPPRPLESHQLPPAASPLEMSCNAAARIIADMQGHGDDRTTRLALGCGAQEEECFVRNTSIFRMLDH